MDHLGYEDVDRSGGSGHQYGAACRNHRRGLGNIDFLEAITPDGGGDSLTIVRGTTQGLNAPLAIDNVRPEFAWSVASSRTGAAVTAAEVEVRDAERAAGADLDPPCRGQWCRRHNVRRAVVGREAPLHVARAGKGHRR